MREQMSENEYQDNRQYTLNNKWSIFSSIPVHGDILIGKANNMIRLFSENVDGFVVPDKTTNKKNKNKNKYKQAYLNNLLSCLEVDILGASET